MAIIRKKTWPPEFEAILSGKKNYDLRLNDFEVREGDVLVLEEWDPKTKAHTGRSIEKRVTYVGKFTMRQPWWSEEDFKAKGIQVMALKDIESGD